MNKLIITIFSFFLLSLSANGQQAKDQYTIQVDGLGCPFCAYGLEKKFKEFKHIDDVKINMENGMFTFTYPDDHALSVEQVEKQVEAAGYTPVTTKIVRTNGEVLTNSNEPAEVSEEENLISASLKVSGNCGMCKARIEKNASKLDGVFEVKWDKKSKLLTLKFDQSTTSLDKIAKKIAESGHDNEYHKTSEETYDSLPGCCQYDRDEL